MTIAKMRTEVVHDGRSHEVLEIPGFEGPARLEKQLSKLAQGLLAIGMGVNEVKRLCRHTAVSCVSPRKVRLFKLLLSGKLEESDNIEMSERMKLGYGVVRRLTNDLYALGLLLREINPMPKKYLWRVSSEFKKELMIFFGKEETRDGN